jgi:glycosyltransferase involved in cell wall biosynthesis
MSLPDRPKVSVAMPVHNGGAYFPQALASVVAQTYDNIEIVVVDDGSVDPRQTEAAVGRYQSPKIIYIQQENQGVAGAMNTAIARMTGSFFCWLSHDDLYQPNKIEAQLAYHAALGKNEAMLFSDYFLIDGDGDMLGEIKLDHAAFAQSPMLPLLNGCINGCTLMIPLAILREFGPFDTRLRFVQDYTLWNRILHRHEFFHQPQTLVRYRIHGQQGTHKPGAVIEGDELWVDLIESRSIAERGTLFGSTKRFFEEMGKFLEGTPYKKAAMYARERARRVVAETLVSVVLPISGETEAVVAASESVLSQTHRRLELLLINEGSSGPPARIEALQRSDARVRLLPGSAPGLAACRNRGLQAAAGEYLAFLDPTDRFTPRKIERQLTAMQDQGSSFSHTSYDVTFPERSWRAGRVNAGRFSGAVYPEIIGNCPIVISTVMLHRSLVDAGYMFGSDIERGEDTMLWISIAQEHQLLGIEEPMSLLQWSSACAAIDLEHSLAATARVLEEVGSHPIHSRHGDQIRTLAEVHRARITAYREAASRPGRPTLDEKLIALVLAQH